MLFVALHRHGPHRRGQRLGDAVQLVLVGEVLAVGAGGDQRLDDLTGVATPLDEQNWLNIAAGSDVRTLASVTASARGCFTG